MSAQSPLSKAFNRYLVGWPVLGVIVITIWSSFRTGDLVEYALINNVYGADAWNNGLRVVDNKGHLSDGRELSGFQEIVMYGGTFLLTLPFFFGSAFGLAYLNMRIHRKRLRDFTKEKRLAECPYCGANVRETRFRNHVDKKCRQRPS